MATFLATMRHTPQSCPLFNPQSRKIYGDWSAKMEETLNKYGVKIVSSCSLPSEHLNILIFEAPSLEAIQKVSMEPEYLAVSSVDTIEIKPAMSFEESMKFFQQLQQVAAVPAR